MTSKPSASRPNLSTVRRSGSSSTMSMRALSSVILAVGRRGRGGTSPGSIGPSRWRLQAELAGSGRAARGPAGGPAAAPSLLRVRLARELGELVALVAGQYVADGHVQPVAAGRQGLDRHAHELPPHGPQHGILPGHTQLLPLAARRQPALEPDARVTLGRADGGLVLEASLAIRAAREVVHLEVGDEGFPARHAAG